jgi:G3E family GTPase
MPIKATRARASASPVYVIAGFLGSGKTTLLKRALAHELERGVKPAVLMNEFGEVDVDGAVLHDHPRSHDIELQSLLSGCVCCDLSGAFTEKIGHLLKKTQGAPLFVETTGLADTGQVVAGVERALAEHSDTGRLASVIVMVDAPRFLKLGAYWPAANDHLKRADMVVLNKLDQIDDRQAVLVEGRVRSTNPAARIVRAVHADVPINRLFEVPAERRRVKLVTGPFKDSTAGVPERQLQNPASVRAGSAGALVEAISALCGTAEGIRQSSGVSGDAGSAVGDGIVIDRAVPGCEAVADEDCGDRPAGGVAAVSGGAGALSRVAEAAGGASSSGRKEGVAMREGRS